MNALRSTTARMPRWLVMLLVAMAGLMLEVGYTRIISFKIWYYYTYLVIGLSLLGIGSGGILVAIWAPLKRATTERIVALSATAGAVSITVGYFLVARLPINTVRIWLYDMSSVRNMALLFVICFVILVTFLSFGVIVAVLLGRAGDDVGRLYFADLTGASLGCLLAIPLIRYLGPPRLIMIAALVFALVGVLSLPSLRGPRVWVGAATSAVLLVLIGSNLLATSALDVRPDDEKTNPHGESGNDYVAEHSDWSSVFRIDVMPPIMGQPNRLVLHDGNFGSSIWPMDGDPADQTRFDADTRRLPFEVTGEPPENNLIIGSAGGNEIQASMYFGVDQIDAVELNPATVEALENEYRDITGNLVDQPNVNLKQGDGRTYLARSENSYDMVWFVAPDSYAANNAASSGAFVLSESYLYTTEMIQETLEHLSDDGIMVVQFGELNYPASPNRTSRYLVTARHALREMGIENPADHLMVSTDLVEPGGDLSTIMVKRTPFTEEEVEGFENGLQELSEAPAPQGQSVDYMLVHAPGREMDQELLDQYAIDDAHRESMTTVNRLAATEDESEVSSLVDNYHDEIDVVRDDAPFFWHFSSFGDVAGDIFTSIDVFGADPEDQIGERVLLLLLLMAGLYAAVFLFLPFLAIGPKWRRMPLKVNSAVYFSCLGLGFMFYEITMIQRLVLFLGYPTLSLTVTLAAILVFTGIGALLSERLVDRSRQAMPVILAVLAVLTVFYQFGLEGMTDSYLSQDLWVRILMSLGVLAPLGLCLGMFMPLGLGVVSKLTEDGQEYVAWSWAINGFFSVIGSVLTTILSMAFGFTTVQYVAFAVYTVAVVSFMLLKRRSEEHQVAEADEATEAAAEAEEAEPEPADAVPAPSTV